MRVYLDACIDPRAVQVFTGHDVRTAFDLGWHQLKDHALLPRVQGNFDVFATLDKGFEFEHNLRKLSFGFLVAHVPKNTLQFYEAIKTDLQTAVHRVRPGQVIHVYSPRQ